MREITENEALHLCLTWHLLYREEIAKYTPLDPSFTGFCEFLSLSENPEVRDIYCYLAEEWGGPFTFRGKEIRTGAEFVSIISDIIPKYLDPVGFVVTITKRDRERFSRAILRSAGLE